MAFAHLHVHTEYSLLDGASRIAELVAAAKGMGMESVAITDHGNMFGVVELYVEAKKAGIKPVIGCEVYTAVRGMEDKDPIRDKYQGHLVLLAENEAGYKNLMKIVSAGFTKGFYYKPRVDRQCLREHSGGIIALSACLKGDVQRPLLADDYAGAKAAALEFIDIFGEGNFFLEIQNQGLEEEMKIRPYMLRLSKETGIPLVATNDVHYISKENAASHDALICIQTGKKLGDEDRMRFSNDQFYLKSEEEMREAFHDLPEAVDNAALVAGRCNVEFDFNSRHLPEFIAPGGMGNADYLRELCEAGMAERYGADKENHRERLEYELSVIESMGFVDYFLIVWDFINYAKDRGIAVGPGRGSAAGSLVSYALRITDIDPIEYTLIFERFLNPERVSMPDIDIDFCYERRGEVIDYVVDKYGEDKVAQIITFGRMMAKAVVRDVGRVIGMPYGDVDRLAKMIPFELKMTLETALKRSDELRVARESDPKVGKLFNIAMDLEGLARNAGTHAAGVVISRDSLDEYVPLYYSESGGVSTQFTMKTVEKLGLLKMDFLGLRNLTVIQDAIAQIKENHGVEVDFSKMKYDDPKVYQLISSGNTSGVFQLESGGMTDFMLRLRPTGFEDIVAGIALFRPGPMENIPVYLKNKKRPGKIKYLHPLLKPILSVSYGVIIYQEQVMQIVRDLAGYSYGKSDVIRRAMSKKESEVMQKERKDFVYGVINEDGERVVPGCVQNGIPAGVANELFDQMISFAEYAFNKSHSAGYAVLTYQTAWLKAYYPVEFMAALMSGYMGDSSQIARYIRNCSEMGIEVMPPGVMESGKKFSVRNGKVSFGLLGVKNVGSGAIDAILEARAENPKMADLRAFLESVGMDRINKKAVESLIKAGAFDCFYPNRAANLAVYEGLMDQIRKENRNPDQISFWDSSAELMNGTLKEFNYPDVGDFPMLQRLSLEKDMLGIFISGHPLDDSKGIIDRIRADEKSFVTTDEINPAREGAEEAETGGEGEKATERIPDNTQVCLAGIITSVRLLIDKKSEQMAFIHLEDLYGGVEVIVFAGVYSVCSECIQTDNIVVLRGRLNYKEDEAPKILASKITPISVVEDYYRRKGAAEAEAAKVAASG